MNKQEIEQLVQDIGEPVCLGGCLSNLSYLSGWTEELYEQYKKYFGSNAVTAETFGFKGETIQ